MRLVITIERDDTGVIAAECPSIPGCISQGETEAEAVEIVREAIQGCLAARKVNNLSLAVEVREVEVEVV